jgi:hypothetical protein
MLVAANVLQLRAAAWRNQQRAGALSGDADCQRRVLQLRSSSLARSAASLPLLIRLFSEHIPHPLFERFKRIQGVLACVYPPVRCVHLHFTPTF